MVTNRKTKREVDRAEEATEQLLHAERTQRIAYAIAVVSPALIASLEVLGSLVNEQMVAQGFWQSDNFGEKIALIHSELSEALEADRKDLVSDHIPDFSGIEEELADVVIRVVDLAAMRGLRLGDAINAKMQYNLSRPFKHGKKY